MINTLLARSKFQQLLGLLGKERVALLNGPLDDLEALAKRRDSLLESMVNGGPVARQVLADGLPEIRKAAGRNARLLKASIDGAKSAKVSLNAIEANASRLKTYNSDGQMVRSAGAPAKPAKRV